LSGGEKTGRNDPCPCGSGLKYKRCCLAKLEAAPPYTSECRQEALAKLADFTEQVLAAEDDEADAEFHQGLEDLIGALDDDADLVSDAVFDMWFWFDRPLTDGRLVVDRLLAEDPSLTPGERRFLELARDTWMRLYEVEDTRPGLSVTLRDILDRSSVTVRERTASKTLKRADLIAARIIRLGASGLPEIENGILPFPVLMRRELEAALSHLRKSLRLESRHRADEAFSRQLPPYLHGAWVSSIAHPRIPRAVTSDGEDLLFSKVRFDVKDTGRAVLALDAATEHGLERKAKEETSWSWTGTSSGRGSTISLGQLELQGTTLVLETLSVARAVRGRAMLESLAGDAIAHRATSHEDPSRLLEERLVGKGSHPVRDPGPSDIPPEVLEDLALDHYARHYRGWLDEGIPALEGWTPRAAARDARLRPILEQLLSGLDGMYEGALRQNIPAYDGSWMWDELGLVPPWRLEYPPSLAQDRWAEAMTGWRDACRAAAERLRGLPGFDDASGVALAADLASDLAVRRLLNTERERLKKDGLAGRPIQDAVVRLERQLLTAVNFELHRRKTFWVDDALAYMLAHTSLDAVGDEMRVPFPSFALVFTDRGTLSLAERLLARDAGCPLAGYLIRVATVFVTEERRERGRVLHLAFAFDALGADPPYLVEHDVVLSPDERVRLPDQVEEPVIVEGETVARTRPLPGLVHLVLNAILYATSAGVEVEVRPGGMHSHGAIGSGKGQAVGSDEVFFLPGKIEISRVRRLQELERVSGGRQLFHRFMVRGHWRRPSTSWKDRRLRWIEPYWKGPDIAAVIERTYALTP